jgi:hypothetical protein
MSDLDLVMQAFNKAQTQGNTEAAKNFAKMALDLDAQFTPAPTPVEREVGIGEVAGIGLERGVGRFGLYDYRHYPCTGGECCRR